MSRTRAIQKVRGRRRGAPAESACGVGGAGSRHRAAGSPSTRHAHFAPRSERQRRQRSPAPFPGKKTDIEDENSMGLLHVRLQNDPDVRCSGRSRPPGQSHPRQVRDVRYVTCPGQSRPPGAESHTTAMMFNGSFKSCGPADKLASAGI